MPKKEREGRAGGEHREEGKERKEGRAPRMRLAGTKGLFLGRVCSRTKNVSVKKPTQSPSLTDRPRRKKGRLSAKIDGSIDKNTNRTEYRCMCSDVRMPTVIFEG